MKTPDKEPPIAVNRKARFDYFIEESYEAGISLLGWEVKSMRAGKAQIAESYVYLKNGEAFLFGAHISPLNSASTHVDTDPTRTRKLLLNRRQLDHLLGAVERRGYTLVPLELYWKEGRAKLQVQRQEAARQARDRQGPRLAARQGPHPEGVPALTAALHRHLDWAGQARRLVRSIGADRFRHGLRNSRGVPRCRLPRKTDLQNYSCQRRQLRSSCLIAAEP